MLANSVSRHHSIAYTHTYTETRIHMSSHWSASGAHCLLLLRRRLETGVGAVIVVNVFFLFFVEVAAVVLCFLFSLDVRRGFSAAVASPSRTFPKKVAQALATGCPRLLVQRTSARRVGETRPSRSRRSSVVSQCSVCEGSAATFSVLRPLGDLIPRATATSVYETGVGFRMAISLQ